MIASIFSKSKPINFLIVFLITLSAFILVKMKLANGPINIVYFLKQALIFFICYGSILVFNFIINRNSLTQKNNYAVLLYCLFLATLPQVMLNTHIVFANLFVLLALRRIISLRSQSNVKKKLLDASVWIAIATLFYFWAIIFFALILAALLLYTENKIKNWIIPFVGLAVVFIISIGYSIIVYDDFFEGITFSVSYSFNYDSYNTKQFLIAITILTSFSIWSSIFYIVNIKKKKKRFRPAFFTVFIAAILAFVIGFISSKKDGSEFIFLFAPISIIIANYIETIEEQWFKEIFLLILIALPIVVLIL